MVYERILVPLDGSPAAEKVLPYVEEIAARAAAELFLVSVAEAAEDTLKNGFYAYLDRTMARVKRELDDYAAKEETTVHHKVIVGRPAPEILRYADENSIDLIAMSASGDAGEERWPMGATASKVLRATSLPVLLIKRPVPEEIAGRTSIIQKVLVPLDGSQLGESALPQVEALAKALDIEVVLLHVMEPILTASMPGLAAVTLPTASEQAHREAAAIDYLQRIESNLQSEGLTATSELRSGLAASEIIAFAEENSIDLIAMSTHGRSGIGRWVFGSVTDKVLHAGTVPVLTVRATGR